MDTVQLERQERLERRAGILKALAHPSRLLVLELLATRPHHVGELRAAIGADLTTVSKHLALLRKVGLVQVERKGTFSWYQLRCDCVNHLLDCIEENVLAGQ